jgi:hypothetical protein
MRVIVSVKDGNVKKVVPRLKQLGMKLDPALDALGIVSGEIDDDKMKDARSIPGITIEPEESVQLPPPDAPIQ